MKRRYIPIVAALALTGCSDNFTPNPKTADYDPKTGELTLPHPCPDWSQSQTHNNANEPHSNYGCAVNKNSAIMVADPNDLYMGHGDDHPDTGITTNVITRYRNNEIPAPLSPIQSTSSGSGQ